MRARTRAGSMPASRAATKTRTRSFVAIRRALGRARWSVRDARYRFGCSRAHGGHLHLASGPDRHNPRATQLPSTLVEMGGACCGALETLPEEWKGQTPPRNTRLCCHIAIDGLRSTVRLGADERGVYLAVQGKDALVPWNQVNLLGEDDGLFSTYLCLSLATVEVSMSARHFHVHIEPHLKHSLSRPASRAPPVVAGAPRIFSVTLPPGVTPGEILAVESPDGQVQKVTLPPGFVAGMKLMCPYIPLGDPPAVVEGTLARTPSLH